MADEMTGGCGCCGPAGPAALMTGAERLGIAGADLAELAALVDGAPCVTVQGWLARWVDDRLTVTRTGIADLVEEAARMQVGAPVGVGADVAAVQARIVDLAARVGPLQAAAARLAEPATAGGCDGGCPCAAAAAAAVAPAQTPRIPLSPADGSDIVCTLDGGADAMRDRIGQWQAVVERATGREPAGGGVTLLFDHDRSLVVELARLGAAEFACCSFFTFTLTVGPPGVRFTVTAPDEARDVVTSMFGAAVGA